jgi:trimethylamine-N-oxide reductase (cytochrome c)
MLSSKPFRSPKLECIVNHNLWLEEEFLYSDIILPISTLSEIDDIGVSVESFTSFCLQKKAIEPMGESKSDTEMCEEIAKKLDFYDKFIQGASVDDLIKLGFETSRWNDLVSWDELKENQYVSLPPGPNNLTLPPESESFYNDPVKNPLRTPSGKLEFESQLLKEKFPDDKERPPLAHYIRGGPASEGWTHDEDLSSDRAKTYPLLMISNTRDFGKHSEHTDIPWTREISKIVCWDNYAYEPVWINPTDANARGIKTGDIVRIYNERGSVLGGAIVCERVISGAIHQDKGGGVDYIIPYEVNRGGSKLLSVLKDPCLVVLMDLAPTGYLVEMERVKGRAK